MRTCVLFIAMSLDGYIAKRDGGVDWLKGEKENCDDMKSYTQFIQDVDTIVMGWNTYDQVKNELSPDAWYYKGYTTYVFTHRDVASSDDIIFVNEDVTDFITKLQHDEGKTIWICGGSTIVHELMKSNTIDRYHISIIPTILGSGLPLFHEQKDRLDVRLVNTQHYNGIVDVIYERRHTNK